MARFNFEESTNYGGGTSSFFNLKNDRDTARVRFLLNDINDLYGVSCHEIDINGKKTDVECLRAYNEPINKCPLCSAGYQVKAKVFVPLYDEDAKASKIWTRSKRFFDKIASLCQRYNPLVATGFEVERNGKTGDPKTTYEIYPGRTDNARIEDYPEVNAEGTAFLTKTYDELETFLRTGGFETSIPQRNTAPGRPTQPTQRQVPIRRTPSRNDDEEIF